jgi:hypothetical protein
MLKSDFDLKKKEEIVVNPWTIKCLSYCSLSPLSAIFQLAVFHDYKT